MTHRWPDNNNLLERFDLLSETSERKKERRVVVGFVVLFIILPTRFVPIKKELQLPLNSIYRHISVP